MPDHMRAARLLPGRLSAEARADLRRERDAGQRLAARQRKEADDARKAARAAVRTLHRYEWDSAYWEGSHPSMSEGMRRNIPRLLGSIERLGKSADTLEAAAVKNQAAADVARQRLARDARPRWWEWRPGLLVLLAVLLGRRRV